MPYPWEKGVNGYNVVARERCKWFDFSLIHSSTTSVMAALQGNRDGSFIPEIN